MHKLLKLVTSITIGIALLPIITNSTITLEAEEYNKYSMNGCSAYETAVVNDQGNFDHKGCYNSFSEAKSALSNLGDDGVIRHSNSYSPTKIIAMNSGVIYSYGRRSGSNTVSFYQYGNANGKTSYMTNYREGYYYATDSYNGDGTGNVHVNISGFDGTIQLKNIDLVPTKFITSNKAIWLGGNDTTAEHENVWSIIPQRSYYVVEQNGSYKELRYVAFGGWTSNDGEAAGRRFNSVIGPAADWMNVGDVYYSLNNYEFYSDMRCNNYVGTYYNYYQFLPLRSKSNIPASAYNSFLSENGYGTSSALWNSGEYFINAQNTYGVNALMLFAQAANESAYGTSYYAKNRNNLFGVAAYDDDPNNASSFASVEDGIYEQAGRLLRNYLDSDYYLNFGPHFGNKGSGITVKYASDIYYGLTLASIAYKFDKYYNNNNGNLTDYNAYTIGNINTYGTSIYASASTSSNVLYSSEYGSSYQLNHTVVILEESNGFYKIQSSDIVYNGTNPQTIYDSRTTYDWDNMVGWIEKDKVNIISGVGLDTTLPEEIGTVTVNVSGLRIRTGAGTGSNYAIVGYAQEGGSYVAYDKKENNGYTWYQIGVNEWIADNGSWLTFKAKKDESTKETDAPIITPEEITESIEGLEKITTPSEDRSLLAGISSTSYDEESHVLTLNGMALFQGMDAIMGEVSHDLLVNDPLTNTSYVVPCTTVEYNDTLFNDGHTYKAICFTVSIDLDMFNNGNYTLGIRLKNGEKSAYYSFFNSSDEYDYSYQKDDDTLVKVFSDPLSNYRYTISAEKQNIDMSVIHKSSTLPTMFGSNSLDINDGHMQMNALAAVYYTDFTTSTNPSYEVILEDTNGKTYTYPATLSSNQMDISSFMAGNHTYNNCTFDVDADLNELPSGTYRIYIHVKTNEVEDIFEMYSIQTTDSIQEVFNNKTYTLGVTNVRSRYILTIE